MLSLSGLVLAIGACCSWGVGCMRYHRNTQVDSDKRTDWLDVTLYAKSTRILPILISWLDAGVGKVLPNARMLPTSPTSPAI